MTQGVNPVTKGRRRVRGIRGENLQVPKMEESLPIFKPYG